ncbi:coiled-coil domain-containing protein 43-like [Acropora muricata]|uniref:coiled-coil domain-containing protein 43-like n=1 Tax=Acropora muricata TaxID=159855 RepID=UPI0034E56735
MADSTSDISDGCEEFKDWLSSRLKTLGLDEDVFGSYVTGVLDSEDTDEERKDALIGILDGMTEYPLEDLCSEVLNRWKSSRAEIIKKRVMLKEQKEAEKQNKLAEIMEKQASMVCTIKPAQGKSDDNIKKMLVAQYGHASDEEIFDGSDDEQVSSSSKDSGVFKNMNAQLVADQEKEKRERLKQENDQRKQQIREAQEKQKQKAEERKEKEKKRTQKGERRTR